MSHDRGCLCGRESYEYDDCIETTCLKKEDKMDSVDWLKAHGLAEPGTKAYGERTVKTEKQYVWVKADRAPMFVTDLIKLYKDSDFDPNEDKIYEIGPEVKLELNVKVTPAKPVYRENASGYRVPFENRD